MRYAAFAAMATVILGILALSHLWELSKAQAQQEMALDAGTAPTTGDTAKVDTPDPLDKPSAAVQFLKEMYKLGIWPLVASILLIIGRVTVKRMEPGPDDKPLTGWRAKTLAIAAAAVAVSGPTLEVLLKTGSVAAIAAGIIYAYGLLKDAFDPPKGSARKATS